MKRFRFAGFFAGLMLLAGCSTATTILEIDPTAAVEQMSQEITFTDQFAPLATEDVNRVYGVDADLVETSAALAGSGATAENLAMWKAVDEDSAQTIAEQVQVFLNGYLEGYAEYKPEEVPKLESAILTQQDIYVVLCVSADNAAAQSVVEAVFEG